MKVFHNGEEIDFSTELEKGELELDLLEKKEDLEDTIDLHQELEQLKKEELLEKTGEIKYE